MLISFLSTEKSLMPWYWYTSMLFHTFNFTFFYFLVTFMFVKWGLYFNAGFSLQHISSCICNAKYRNGLHFMKGKFSNVNWYLLHMSEFKLAFNNAIYAYYANFMRWDSVFFSYFSSVFCFQCRPTRSGELD